MDAVLDGIAEDVAKGQVSHERLLERMQTIRDHYRNCRNASVLEWLSDSGNPSPKGAQGATGHKRAREGNSPSSSSGNALNWPQDLLDVVTGLLEFDPNVRMSVGEAHQALLRDSDAVHTDPAPHPLAGVQQALATKISTSNCNHTYTGTGKGKVAGKGKGVLDAKVASLVLLHDVRRMNAAAPRVAAKLLEKADGARKRARRE